MIMKCAICDQETKNANALAKHLFYSHKDVTKQEYYDKFIVAPLGCNVCGSPTKFLNLGAGYVSTCSPKCCTTLQWQTDDGSRKAKASARFSENNIGIPGARLGRPNKKPFVYTEEFHLRMKRLNSGQAKRPDVEIVLTQYQIDSLNRVFGII